MYEYKITLDSDQAHIVNKAIELLMRLKINQPHEISMNLLDSMYERLGIDEYCRRKDMANKYLDDAFKVIYPTWEEVKKDDEWHILYNVFQVIRKAIHDAEHPNGNGVDSYPPRPSGGQPLPKIEWNERSRQ